MRKFIFHLFILLAIFLSGMLKSSGQTANATIIYSGAQALGCCNVCGLDYWCINNTGGCGTTSTCVSETFMDPVPAGNIVTHITIEVWSAQCSGSAITAYVNSNVFPVVYEGSTGCPCSSNPCGMTTSTGSTFPCGIAGYNYGANNTLQLCTGVDVCVQHVVIVLTYVPASQANPPSAPGAITGPLSLCAGHSGTYTIPAVTGAASYAWTVPAGWTITSGAGTTTITVTAGASSGNICVTPTNLCGTSGPACITVTINPNPTVTIAASPNPVCLGTSTTLTASGASTYIWSGGLGTSNPLTVSPTTTTTYTVTGTNASGCTNTASITVTISPNLTVNISASSNPICLGTSTTLTATGGTTYVWSGGLGTANPLTVTPTGATTYTVTGTNASGCTGTASINITISPNLTVSISASANPICLGASTTLTATGGTTYIWSGGLGTANPLIVTPTTNTTYTVTGTNASGCTGTGSISVTVNPKPTVSVSASVTPICAGASTTLTASGANTYTWSGGLGTANPLTVTPTITTTYTVTGTSAVGCTNTASITVTVNPLPAVSITASSNPICAGTPTTLTATGGTTYLWSGGLGTANPLTVSPTTTTTYSVTGTTAGCTGTASITITVNSTTPISVTASANPICAGIPTTLTATGGTTYLWSGGLGTANPLTVSPMVTTTYTVIGTNATGCTGTASITININPNLIINIAASANPICIGASTTLTASGGNTYFWSGGFGNANPLTVTPNSTTTYNVTGTDLSGCTGTGSITVTVNPLPTVSISAFANPICTGTSTTLTAAGASTYIWGGGLGTANPLTISPTTNTTYTVTGTDVNGCTGTSSITVNVNPNPTVSISASANPICVGSQTILTASGALTYLWGGGLGTSNPLITTPASTTNYTVTGTDINGCTGSANITITVNNNPTVSITPSVNPICNGSSTDLVANGGTTYSWNGGSTANPMIVTPISTTTYTVTGTTTGCTGTATITVTINPNPIVSASASASSICAGSSTTLTAGGASTYSWDNGLGTANPVTITPSVTTTYTVTGTTAGCTGTASITVTVNSIPTVSATSTNENCHQSNGTATATPGGVCASGYTYTWNCSPAQNTAIATHLPAGTYTVTIYCNSCSATASTIITNLPGPSVAISNVTNTICGYADGGASASATGNNPPFNYTWSNGQTGAGLANVIAGSYIVTATDAVGCTATNSVTLTNSPAPTASVTEQNEICNMKNGSATVTAIGGMGTYTYIWSNGETGQTATGLSQGVYTVTVSDGQCTASVNVNVYETPGPNAAFAAHPNIVTISQGPVQFTDMSSGNVISWYWNFGDGSLGNGVDPTHTYPNVGTYVVTEIVTDNNGCQDTATDTIKVKDIFAFYIPSAFTPNEDGFNDVFAPKGVNVDPKNFNEYIFDRWGNLYFYTTKWDVISKQAEAWNGTKNNNGDYTNVVMGAYVYRITLKEINGIGHEYIGRITLIP